MTRSERSTHHDTFTLERVYDAAPAEVFLAFADPKLKARWFSGPSEWQVERALFEFRVGGRERVISRPAAGPAHRFDATYVDIVRDARIVYTYTMHSDDTLTSVSVATVELAPAHGKTAFRLTEQGVFVDGYNPPGQREAGTRALLDQLGNALARGR
jgi:uncharacterized protein YndB with AHSA1/START domain